MLSSTENTPENIRDYWSENIQLADTNQKLEEVRIPDLQLSRTQGEEVLVHRRNEKIYTEQGDTGLMGTLLSGIQSYFDWREVWNKNSQDNPGIILQTAQGDLQEATIYLWEEEYKIWRTNLGAEEGGIWDCWSYDERQANRLHWRK